MRKLHLHIEATPRTLLFFYAVLVLLITAGVSSAGFLLNNPYILLAGLICLVVWFFILFKMAMPGTDSDLNSHLNGIKKGAQIIFISVFVLGLFEAFSVVVFLPVWVQNPHISSDFRQLFTGLQESYRYNDATALSQQAAEDFLQGQNPYEHSNIVEALLKYDGIYTRVTPLRVGVYSDIFPYPDNTQLDQVWSEAIQNPSQVPAEFETKVCYPAGSFLLPAPFIFLGITDIRIVYLIFVLAALVYTVWAIPKQKRWLFIGALLISLDLWNSIAGGETGSLSFALLLVAWVALNKNIWLSAVCMGLAVATKQTAWFLLPFYIILLFKTQGIKKLMPAAGVIGGIFIAANLPYLIMNPQLWLTSITSPMTDPMFPIGGGLTVLATGGFVNIHTALPFTVMEAVAFIGAIVWYLRYGYRYPQTGPILAIIPLFFAWRSLWSYFFYAAIITLAYILVNENPVEKPNLEPMPDLS